MKSCGADSLCREAPGSSAALCCCAIIGIFILLYPEVCNSP